MDLYYMVVIFQGKQRRTCHPDRSLSPTAMSPSVGLHCPSSRGIQSCNSAHYRSILDRRHQRGILNKFYV